MSGRLQCNTILITASRLFSLQSTETDGEHLHMVQRHSCKSSISAKTNKIPSRPSCSDQFILESKRTLASNFKISPRGVCVQDNGTDSTLMWPLTTKFYSVHPKYPEGVLRYYVHQTGTDEQPNITTPPAEADAGEEAYQHRNPLIDIIRSWSRTPQGTFSK